MLMRIAIAWDPWAMVICAGIDRERSGGSAQEIEHRTDHGLCGFFVSGAPCRTDGERGKQHDSGH